MKLHLHKLLLIALLPMSAHAADSGTTTKSDTLRAAPFVDARSVTTLPSGSPVEILKRDGGWYQIKSPQGTGWLRMLSIRRGAASPAGAQLSGLSSLASGRAGTGRVVSTTGIRGLNEEELKAAQYDEKQVTLAESYLTSKSAAEKFAAQGKLKSQNIDYLPEPKGTSK